MCLSLAIVARWLVLDWCRVTYKVDLIWHESENSSLSCESPVATSYRPARVWAPIYQSHQQKPAGRCAVCYLTWLSGSSSTHYCTQTHSPVMIYCCAAYGITLEPSGQKAARCFREQNNLLTTSWSWKAVLYIFISVFTYLKTVYILSNTHTIQPWHRALLSD